MKLKNLFGASLMTLSLMLSVAPQTVLADDETTDVYVTSVETAAATLTDEQYKIYSVAKQQIAEIAAGKRDYAVVEVNIRDTFGQETLDKYNYTLSELGLSESNFDSNGIGDVDADTAFQYKWEEDASFNFYSNGGSYRINHAVFLSLGYEIYWYDRAAQGYAAWPVRVVLKTLEDGSKVVGMDETSYIPLSFGVSKKYQGNGEKDTFLEQWYRDHGYEVPNFTVNTSLTSATSAQVLRVARKVVADNANKTDLEKLYAYKNWICDNVGYDDSMSQYVGEKYDMGDSGELTNVFDEDSSTNVVCEGYAKAFKLLCDLSDFQDETLKCNIVMGPTNGSAGGSSYGEDHMWNVVTVNGKNYIADVTNSDAGSVGSAGVYFMVGGNRISSWSGFGYSMSGNYIADNGSEGGTAGRVNHSMTYKYDDDTQDTYDTAALTIDANSPVVFTTVEEAGRYVAEQMRARKGEIAVSCSGVSSSVDLRTAVINEAFRHTGEAGYGDNLKRQIDSYLPATSNNTVMYDCAYFDTAEQVAEFEVEAEEVLAGMNLEGKTDYEKVQAIYNWICRNIDYQHDEATALQPKHTASGALRDRTAVCAGYANLTYYFLLKAGIDNRIVVSTDHAWNIVKLGDWYYNIDTTWDAGNGIYSWDPYLYFLKTDDAYRAKDIEIGERVGMDDYYTHHVRLSGDDCTTDEFLTKYPMARYNYGEEPEMTEAKVTVSFNDEENPSVRPESVTVTLNDGKYDYPVNLTAEGNWTASVNVPKEGTYTGTASAVTGYTASETAGDLTNGFTVEYVLNHYTVTWKNDNGTVLETDTDVAHGLTPEYNGETPVKAESESVRYIFNGWSPAIKPATADVTYTASFQSKYKTYLSRYSCKITLAENSFVYDGTEKKPEVAVKYDSYPSKDLTEGVDYTLAYENNINAGTATVSVTGIGDYYGTVTTTFTIAKAEQKLTVTPTEITLKVGATAELTVEADDEVTYTSADTAVATVENGTITAVGSGETTITVTVPEKENYKAATAEVKVTVEVDPVDISTLTVKLAEENFVYDGTEKKPAVTVENNDAALTEGTDYKVAYENNINAGTATVIVTGIGNYFGTVTKTFEIAKAEQNLTVSPTEVTLKISETAELTVEADAEAVFTSVDETIATVENGTITAVGTGETAITVTLAETDNFKAAAAEVKVTVVPPTELEVLAEDITNTETPEEVVTFEGTEEEVQEVKEKIEEVKTSGETLTVELEENTMTEVPETETTLVVETVKPDEQTQIEYFDVNLLLKAGEEQIAKIVETKEPITVTLPLSEEAKGADQYKVIRVHEGIAKELECTVSEDGNYISFRTDKFSTYAVVYQQKQTAEIIEINSASVALNEKIQARIYVYVPASEMDTTYVTTTFNGVSKTELARDMETAVRSERDCVVAMVDTFAKQMRDEIVVKVHEEDGTPKHVEYHEEDVTAGFTFHVADYVKLAEDNSTDEKLIDLVHKMNWYGLYAQKQFNYSPVEFEKPKEITEFDDAVLSDYAVKNSEEIEGIKYTSGSLQLDSDTGIKVYFTVDEEHSIEDYTFTIGEDTVTPVLKSGRKYYVTIKNVAAKELNKWHTITVTDQAGNTLTTQYCGLSYAYAVVSNANAPETLKDLCRSIYLYGDAAYKYFPSTEKN